MGSCSETQFVKFYQSFFSITSKNGGSDGRAVGFVGFEFCLDPIIFFEFIRTRTNYSENNYLCNGMDGEQDLQHA